MIRLVVVDRCPLTPLLRPLRLVPAAIGAVAHLLPDVLPFAAPLEGAAAGGAGLGGAVGVVRHDRTLAPQSGIEQSQDATDLRLDHFVCLGIRLDSNKARSLPFTINLFTTDNAEKFVIEMSNLI